jgi:hypothetical protein
MRLTLVAPLVAPLVMTALASCGAPKGEDLKIDVFLAMDSSKCVVRFDDTGLKDARRAIAWTNHAVIWRVVRNDCGEKTKIDKKALGLRYVKVKSTGKPATWFDQCTKLDRVPATGTVEFKCQIPSAQAAGWEWTDEVQIYEYEIDGDSVEPVDPDLGIKRNG